MASSLYDRVQFIFIFVIFLSQATDGSDGEIKATMISAVGMALENGEAVVIAINRYSAEHHLLVYIDDLLLDFTQHGSTWHETEGNTQKTQTFV